MEPSDAHLHNRNAWDRLAAKGDRLARPARDEDFTDPLATVDGMGWLGGNIHGKRVLCLAAGGGRQGPIYAAAGAEVTVFDLSPAMLELDRVVSEERKLPLRTVEGSMDNLGVFLDQSFDIVIHPVSTCYIPDVRPVYTEVSRVLIPGGIYISQHKQPTSLQSDIFPVAENYQIRQNCYEKTPLPSEARPNPIREIGAREYIHRWEELIGAMCMAGFVIEALTEPVHAVKDAAHGTFGHRSQFLPPYVRIKAMKRKAGVADTRIII